MRELRQLIESKRELAEDDETRGYAELARRDIWPRLAAAGWVLRMEGEDGIGCADRGSLRLIHSIAREEDGKVWVHVSCSRRDKSMPDWSQVRDLWWAMYPDTVGVIVVAPRSEHVNRAEVAHVWGCLGERVLPDFTRGTGSI